MKYDLNNIELNLKEKKEFFFSFASLYESGLAVGDIFKSIQSSTKNQKIKLLCMRISISIDKGKSIKEAVSLLSKSIGIAYSALLAAGEESGKLENILSGICSNIEKQQEIKSNLINALTYPAFMFFVSVLVALFFYFCILPSFKLISDYDSNMTVSQIFIFGILKMIIVFLFILGLFFYIFKTKKIREFIKQTISSFWFINGILQNYYFSNFFYVLSLSYDAGVPSSVSVMLANSVIGIDNIKNKIKQAEKMIEKGKSVSISLNLTGVFSGFAISQISAGEEAGMLDKSYGRIAKDYENQMDLSIKIMQKLIGPIVLIFVGIIIAIITAKGYSEYYKSILSLF